MSGDTRVVAWWSQAIMIGAIVGAVLLPLGALGHRIGVWSFGTGFVFLAAGAFLSIIVVLGGIAALIAALRTGREADRPFLYIGLLIGGAIVVLMLAQIATARSVPPIHNISTDTADPPSFDVVTGLRGADSNPVDYDAAKLAPLQEAAYPRVKPIVSDRTVAESFDRALNVLNGMGLEVVNADRAAGRLEAVATSFWFGFKDDLVVRVRARGAGSVVDLHSVSRVGQSDLGINAKRIEEFIDRFNAA
jgi:uncharacterized protein (DUF1499 family)